MKNNRESADGHRRGSENHLLCVYTYGKETNWVFDAFKGVMKGFVARHSTNPFFFSFLVFFL